jgi:hypothetical protein
VFGVGAYAPREERGYEGLRSLRGDVIMQVLDWIGYLIQQNMKRGKGITSHRERASSSLIVKAFGSNLVNNGDAYIQGKKNQPDGTQPPFPVCPKG